jgi:tetraacyldisaccharide 4'-kinase
MVRTRAETKRPANAGEASDEGPPARLVASPLARLPLGAAAAAYSLVVRARNGLFEAGLLRTHSVPARVVSIGNVVAGGTGKTPAVALLARIALERGRRVAILSRGYGRRAGDELNDEGRLLSAKLPEALVIEDRDRVAGARRAIARGANLLLLDDGLQHRRLRRDADVVLVDATRSFDEERLLPLGFLREPASSALGRAEVALLTRAELATPESLAALRSSVARWCGRIAVAETVVTGFSRLGGKGPAEGPAFLFAGIGNPTAFRRTAARAGIDVVGFRAFRDHHPYGRRDVDRLVADGASAGATRFLTTEKDAVKLGSLLSESGPPFEALEIGMRILTGEDALLAALFGRG